MRDLCRYVVNKYTNDWKSIGIELGVTWETLTTIEQDNRIHGSETCFKEMLNKWLHLNSNPTWQTLEVAITNVKRQKLGYEPVEYVYGKHYMH